MVALPIWLLLSPANYFDEGEPICPSKVFLGKECPGCGMTRATQHIIHFDFDIAWEYNKLSFFLLPFLGFLYVSIFIKFIKKSSVFSPRKKY